MEELERRDRTFGAGQGRAHARRYSPLHRKATQSARGIVRPGAFLGFNCGHCDFNLIKEHFAELLADTTAKVQVGKKREHDNVHEDEQFPLS